MTAAPALRRWALGALWLGAWPLAGGLSRALLRGEAIPACGFQALTGCPCPLCGGTHLVQALTRWDWAGAWLVLGWRTAAGRRGHQTWAPWKRRLLWTAVVFWLGEWAWRVGASLSGANAVSG